MLKWIKGKKKTLSTMLMFCWCIIFGIFYPNIALYTIIGCASVLFMYAMYMFLKSIYGEW